MSSAEDRANNAFIAAPVIKDDPILDYIAGLTSKVQELENDALQATRQRWETVGTAIAQIGIGSASLTDIFLHNLHLWTDTKPDFIIIAISSALIVRGLANAGSVPERFRQTRQLVSDTHMLRTSLTNAFEEAIRDTPYRHLEATSAMTPNQRILPPVGS